MGSGAKDPAQGPPLHVIAAYPAPGEGESCAADAGPECGVPIDAPIELRFDRFLLPSTAVRQSLLVCPGPSGDNCVLFKPFYDVVERVVSYRLVPDNSGAAGAPGGGTAGQSGAGGAAGRGGAGGTAGVGALAGNAGQGGNAGTLGGGGSGANSVGHWLPDTVYTVELITPGDAGAVGFRAFDGAPLEASDAVPLHYSFKTGSTASNAPPLEPPAPTMDAIQTLLKDLERCGTCHTPDAKQGMPMGFNVNDLTGTAIDEVAHETAIAGTSHPLVNPRFGANMPIIERGEPSNSYLLYKVLLSLDNYATLDCSSRGLSSSDCSGGSDNWCMVPADCSADPAMCAARIACVVDSEASCYRAALPSGASIAPSADELRRLRNWFGAGEPMPLPFEDDAGVVHPVHLGKVELRMIQAFIANSKDCAL